MFQMLYEAASLSSSIVIPQPSYNVWVVLQVMDWILFRSSAWQIADAQNIYRINERFMLELI